MRFLTLACALAALLLLALVSSIWFLRAAGLPQDRTPVLIEVAGQNLRIDPAFVRRRNDLLHRQHEEFELVAVWPDLEPAAHLLGQTAAEELLCSLCAEKISVLSQRKSRHVFMRVF
jgi:hypothetical protein